MPFQDANSQIEPLLFQMKQYKNLTKSTIEILPSSGQTDYGPHRRCIFTLPYASLISLEDLAFKFEFVPVSAELAPSTTGSAAPVYRVLPPKDVASLIAEVDIKINGQTIQHLTRYNDIVNLLNFFERPKTAKHVLQGFNPEITQQRDVNGVYTTIRNANYDFMGSGVVKPMNVPKKYVINHWYGLLGHRGKDVSSNFIDTNMLGEITIAFVFATPSVCIARAGTQVQVQAQGGQPNTPDAKVPAGSAGATTAAQNAIIDAYNAAIATPTSYIIRNPKMSMVRYNLPTAYSEAVRSHLSNGSPYQIAFNHYEIHSQNANASDGNIRWNENSRDIKGLLAFFTNNARDTNTGTDYDQGLLSSKYFLYDNPIHERSQFQIGSVKMPQNELDTIDCFLELVRGVPGARGNNREFGLGLGVSAETVEHFTETCFMAYLSLEWSEGMTELANGGKKLLSGLSSEQLPISCSYYYNNDMTFKGTYPWDKTVNVMSLTTRLLVIENGQNVHVEI
jgi:hypothetical protein